MPRITMNFQPTNRQIRAGARKAAGMIEAALHDRRIDIRRVDIVCKNDIVDFDDGSPVRALAATGFETMTITLETFKTARRAKR